MIALSPGMYARLLRECEGAQTRPDLNIGMRHSFFGMRVIQSPYVPKAKVPVRPHTDDMRAMVADLIDRGVATAQFVEREQALILPGLGGWPV